METKPLLPLFILKGHEGGITSLHFTDQGDNVIVKPSLISGSDIGEIFIWNLKINRTYHRFTGHEKKMIMYLNYFKSSLISQGRDGVVNIWNFLNNEWLVISKIMCSDIGFCPLAFYSLDDNAYLITVDKEKSVLNLHNYQTKELVNELKMHSLTGMCMCMKTLHIEGKTYLLTGYENGFIALWNLETNSEISSMKFHEEPVMCLDFDSQNINRGISGSVDKFLETWKITDKFQLVKVQQVPITNPGVNAVRIREDGKIVITAGWDCNIRVFSWKSLKPLAVIKFHSQSVICLSYCKESIGKNKSIFASGSKDKNIALWCLY